MENLAENIYTIATVLTVILTFLANNAMKIRAIIKYATESFWVVEELAIAANMSSKEKTEAFKVEFKEFMKNNMYWATEKNVKVALKIAMAIAAKTRPLSETREKKAKAAQTTEV